jgi:hypothetical protein
MKVFIPVFALCLLCITLVTGQSCNDDFERSCKIVAPTDICDGIPGGQRLVVPGTCPVLGGDVQSDTQNHLDCPCQDPGQTTVRIHSFLT